MQILIVTPDLLGPVKNGGIGTHCYHLARLLAQEATLQVSILFTLDCTKEDREKWTLFYKQLKIALIFLPSAWEKNTPQSGFYYHDRAYAVYTLIKEKNWDIIHFRDYKADGFVAIRAKKNGHSIPKNRTHFDRS